MLQWFAQMVGNSFHLIGTFVHNNLILTYVLLAVTAISFGLTVYYFGREEN
jgi:hypothetical protein